MTKKEEIIQACIHLICQKGIDLSSMQDIGKEVGLTKSSLYFYFDSKESLINEVYMYCHNKDVKACNEGIDELHHTIDKLIKRFDNIINYAIDHPQLAKVENIMEVAPQYQTIIHLASQDFMNDILNIVDEGIDHQEIVDIPDWLIAQAYYGFCESMYKKFIFHPDLWEDEKIKSYCHEIIKNIFKREENKNV